MTKLTEAVEKIILTKQEKEQIENQRKKEKLAKEEADWIEQYDNCYCKDDNGNWK
jgi:hypothetical protein